MRAFIVKLENRPGRLAEVLQVVADRGVNLTAAGGAASGEAGAVALIADDETGLQDALAGGGATYEDVELVSAELEDRPGTLADAARRLGDAGVNITALVPTGMIGGRVSVAFGVDDADAARRALTEMTGTGAGMA